MSAANEELFRRLCSNIRAQVKSTEMWYKIFTEQRDASSVRNAAMALGKLSGMYQVLAAVAEEFNMEVPAEIFQANAQGQERWESLSE